MPPRPARRRSLLARGAAWLLAAGLAGCAAPVPIAPPGDDAAVRALSRTGRFALTVRMPGESPQAVQGGLAWRDDGRHLQLDLVSPLGTTLARVDVTPEAARLREANGQETVAADADALLARVLGGAMPVSGLRRWLRGDAGLAAGEVQARDAQGRPSRFVQDGWRVQVNAYDRLGPIRLSASRLADDGRDVDLRLALDAADEARP